MHVVIKNKGKIMTLMHAGLIESVNHLDDSNIIEVVIVDVKDEKVESFYFNEKHVAVLQEAIGDYIFVNYIFYILHNKNTFSPEATLQIDEENPFKIFETYPLDK